MSDTSANLVTIPADQVRRDEVTMNVTGRQGISQLPHSLINQVTSVRGDILSHVIRPFSIRQMRCYPGVVITK